MYDVVFTTTACVRPDILDETYRSFSSNMTDMDLKEYTLYINVDPMPQRTSHTQQDVVNVAEKYFGKVIANTPKEANFCRAIKWLWHQAQSKYVFHLEDDWSLLKPTLFSNILKRFVKYRGLYQVRLNKNPKKKSATRLYGLSPCVCRKDFYEAVAKNLNPKRNPERQLRDVKSWGIAQPSKHRVMPFPKNETIVKDIGRDWRVKHGMSKEINENKFIKWKYMKRIEK